MRDSALPKKIRLTKYLRVFRLILRPVSHNDAGYDVDEAWSNLSVCCGNGGSRESTGSETLLCLSPPSISSFVGSENDSYKSKGQVYERNSNDDRESERWWDSED